MKRLRIGSVVLLAVSTAVFMLSKIYEDKNSDYVPPVITFPEEELVVSVNDEEDVLLQDVKAEDEKSGDVSEALVVESISGFTEEGVRTITYAAIDHNGNVGRKERELRYEDYRPPKFSVNRPLRYPSGKAVNVLGGVGAESVLDGDLSSKIKYSLDQSMDVMTPGNYPVEFRVMDSGGNTMYLNTNLEIYDFDTEKINVNLNQYITYLNVNDAFDPNEYYAGASEEGALEIQSAVDTATPGVYHVDYIVRSEAAMGKSRLIVVVTGV